MHYHGATATWARQFLQDRVRDQDQCSQNRDPRSTTLAFPPETRREGRQAQDCLDGQRQRLDTGMTTEPAVLAESPGEQVLAYRGLLDARQGIITVSSSRLA